MSKPEYFFSIWILIYEIWETSKKELKMHFVKYQASQKFCKKYFSNTRKNFLTVVQNNFDNKILVLLNHISHSTKRRYNPLFDSLRTMSVQVWQSLLFLNPKWCGLFGGVLFGEMKFFLSNFLSNENLSSSYESWDVLLTFDTLINAFRFKA